MQLLMALALIFQAINPYTTVTVTENYPQYNNSSAFGVTSCEPGRVRIEVWRYSSVQTLLHEAAHAYDCIDNWTMDGSPLPELCNRGLDCAETYAYWVEYRYQYK